MERIPVLDLLPEIEALWDELNGAIQEVVRSGQFVMGPVVETFEIEVADYLGVGHAIAVNSGTDALVIGLRALGIGPGDEVITTAFTFFATAEAISQVGATPIFVDIDPKTYNIDTTLIEEKITPRTKALLGVHLFGQAADIDSILALAEEHNLVFVEDVAQAFGGEYNEKKLGTMGDVGAFSFFPSKILGAYGDGGLITTNNERVAEVARMLRVHGAKKKYSNEIVGYNSRLDSLQAAILRVKLPHVDVWSERRRLIAREYDELLDGLPQIVLPYETLHAKHVYHQYTVRILNGKRDWVRKRLAEEGIETIVYYPVPVHKLPVYVSLNHGSLPLAEEAASQVLSLPIWPQMLHSAQERVAEVLGRVLR
jgi:dTDP-4-amino-4,6-dideoxygalactose transaminase